MVTHLSLEGQGLCENHQRRIMKKKEQPRKSSVYGRYSPRATLAVVGLKISSMKSLDLIKQNVIILQKSLLYAPAIVF
jgi:hypothetical protein